jgi:hypothetical protein
LRVVGHIRLGVRQAHHHALVIKGAEREVSAREVNLLANAIAVAVLFFPFGIAGGVFGLVGLTRDDDLIAGQTAAAVLLDDDQHFPRPDHLASDAPEICEVDNYRR